MKTTTFRIEGMRCNGCAQTVKTLVESEPGVKATAVSFKDGQARVMYDPNTVDEQRLADVMQKPGYRVTGRQ